MSGGAFLRQREATVLVVTIALIIYFSLASSNFLGKSNLITWLSEDAASIIIIAIGEVLLLICGEIDLSVGFVYTFSAFVMHYLIDFYHFPGILAILCCLLMGLVVGWVNAFLTVTVGLPSFITTLGTGFVLLGLVDTTSHAQPASVPASVQGIGHWIGSYAWSEIIWAVVLVAIFHVVLTRTRWGLHTVAVGGNLLGAQEAGIKVKRIKYGNFMITALARRVRRPPGGVPDEHDRPDGGRLPADVLRRDRRGHRWHGHARRGGHDPGRLPGRDRAGHPDRRVQHHRHQRQPAGHHLRGRDPHRHDRERAARQAAGSGTKLMTTTTPEGAAASAAAGDDILRVEHISKRYGAVTALTDVSMHLGRGEVLGLLGDNGAGKSTLLKILCGFQPPTTGRILLEGQEIVFKSVDHARSLGIDAVYQDLALVNQLSVYHNMFLNREQINGPLLNNRSMRKLAREHLEEMGIKIPSVNVEVAKLSGGQRQAIAVARSVYSNPKILLLDEPLAAMGVKEGAIILDLVRELKEQGDVSIIIIAHNYAQVLEVCDRVNLIQHGEITVDKRSADTSVTELTEMVVAEYRKALEERHRLGQVPRIS